jgi:concentrative nucleoside transporter, CNT family
MPLRLVSLLGLVVLIALAWALSNNRRSFPWRTVLWGLGLQFFFALFILKTPAGQRLFAGAQYAVNQLNVYANEGAKMVFGPLAAADALKAVFGPAQGYIFAVSITATIILVSALSSLLYHWGILQRVVAAMAWVMQKSMGTSGVESLGAASNTFLGQTEGALLIKPYLPTMTPSEIMALMTCGFSTIASGVMAIYAGLEGLTAGHIVTASALGAPAGLMMAKVMFPESEPPPVDAPSLARFGVEKTAVNGIDALCRGASEGLMLSLNVLGMLIAFVAVIALLNGMFLGAQHAVGLPGVTLQQVMGWLNAPFAWLMGIPAKDCATIGQMLGERIVLNEFVGYLDLSTFVTTHPGQLDSRSVTLASYALCGFANFGSIAIQIGGIGALAPARRGDLARIGLRAMIAGLLACYLFASVIGVIL